MKQTKLSVVIPTHLENDEGYLEEMVSCYPSNPQIEYLVVCSPTDKKRFRTINRNDFSILEVDKTTRAAKLNYGFKMSKGDILIFHHPRSLIDPSGFQFLIEQAPQIGWGGFTHKFDHSSLGLKFTSWYSNLIRPKLWKVIYLDHCIFFKREMLTRPIPDIPIFEDTELSYILAENDKPDLLPFISKTSAVRFKKNGFLKQGIMNQKLKLDFFTGRSLKKMNDRYEKNLNLNG